MSDEERRCGTCRWFRVIPKIEPLGRCKFVLPQYATGPSWAQRESDGEKCPCWARKESDDAR